MIKYVTDRINRENTRKPEENIVRDANRTSRSMPGLALGYESSGCDLRATNPSNPSTTSPRRAVNSPGAARGCRRSHPVTGCGGERRP